MEIYTLSEVADEFRCGTAKVSKVARAHRIGAQLGGRAGWRFTEDDKAALLRAMRPPPPEPIVRRRRRREPW